jgi:energy-coupling factor transport system ATP-binding protein
VPDSVLSARGFGYRYPGAPRPALSGVTLDLPRGSFTVVAGSSGSGKSTLLRAACGLVPHFHGGDAEGELEVAGLALRDHGPGELAAVCGTVFQDPETQVVMGGVRAEIALPLEHRGQPAAAVARAVEETALALGIAHLLDRRTDTLSGGELQRVALAAALVHRPELVVLDEPTSQLDPVAGDELVGLLRRLNEEWGTSVLLAEHRLERCLAAADRVLALRDGEVGCDGSPGEFHAWAADHEPNLLTPVARMFSLAGLRPLPSSVKQARAQLAGLRPGGRTPEAGGRGGATALRTRNLWHEIHAGPAILRGIDLELLEGERVALMGRNGAGKSTLLRHVRGLVEPTRGKIERSGDVALLLQNPGDYLVHERVDQETGARGVAAAGLESRAGAHPHDLSGGERQRLALEVALGDRRWAVVLLDEPTRGMDREHRQALVARLRQIAEQGAAVLVATHDPEFAVEVADRVVLMGQGEVIADGSAEEVLAGGWYFTTEVARVVGGAALTAEDAARALRTELVT